MSFFDKWGPPLESGGGLAALTLLARLVKRWRYRARFGAAEDEALAIRNARMAAEAVSDVLGDLRAEREDDRKQVARLNGIIATQRDRIDALVAHVVDLEDRLATMGRQLGAARSELDAARIALEAKTDGT